MSKNANLLEQGVGFTEMTPEERKEREKNYLWVNLLQTIEDRRDWKNEETANLATIVYNGMMEEWSNQPP